MTIQQKLFALKDEEYRNFTAPIIPTVPIEKIIGVRVPKIRELAKTLSLECKTSKETETEISNFLENLPHEYYEENILHGSFLEKIKDFDELLEKTKKFLPFVDNWAVCDMKLSTAFKKNLSKLLENINVWIKSDKAYTVRFAIGLLMRLFLDEKFDSKYLEMVSSVEISKFKDSDEYYVKMMIAWYFATALAKQWDSTFPFIQSKKLEKWTHNKTIQKACESFRVSDEHKSELRKYKIHL